MIEIVLGFRINLLDLFDTGLLKLLDVIVTRRKKVYIKWASLKHLI